MRQVVEEALDYLALRPRHVKLFLNRFRLATLIRLRRGQKPITHQNTFRELAKWTALSIQCPGFVQYIAQRPDALATIQAAARLNHDEKWKEERDKEGQSKHLDDRLRALLPKGVLLTAKNLDFAALL